MGGRLSGCRSRAAAHKAQDCVKLRQERLLSSSLFGLASISAMRAVRRRGYVILQIFKGLVVSSVNVFEHGSGRISLNRCFGLYVEHTKSEFDRMHRHFCRLFWMRLHVRVTIRCNTTIRDLSHVEKPLHAAGTRK